MIDTYSSFFYGVQIDGDSNRLSIRETDVTVSISITAGAYSVTTLLNEISRKLNSGSLNDYIYNVSMNRETRVVTITCNNPVTIYNAGGESPLLSVIGFASADLSGVVEAVGEREAVKSFHPQMLLQDYVPLENSKGVVAGTRSISLSGKVQAVKWGAKRTTRFNIKWQTNKSQGAGGWIQNDPSGCENLNDFMNHVTNQNLVEFMPDRDDPETFYTLLIESTPQSSEGLEYELKERYDINLRDYYESGTIKFREVKG